MVFFLFILFFLPPSLYLFSHRIFRHAAFSHARLLPKTKWMVWFGVKTLRRFLVGGQKSGIDCDSSLHGCLRFLHRCIRGASFETNARPTEKKNKREKKNKKGPFFHMQLRNSTLAGGKYLCCTAYMYYRSDTPATCQRRSCSIQAHTGTTRHMQNATELDARSTAERTHQETWCRTTAQQ
ncbi:hypothetical protein F4805DRAFT_300423 [Annulohypoxylon moriforme]|nr:hypothetical protein F4805DRAFT_300423 [Annulohypoxylon moriforme]